LQPGWLFLFPSRSSSLFSSCVEYFDEEESKARAKQQLAFFTVGQARGKTLGQPPGRSCWQPGRGSRSRLGLPSAVLIECCQCFGGMIKGLRAAFPPWFPKVSKDSCCCRASLSRVGFSCLNWPRVRATQQGRKGLSRPFCFFQLQQRQTTLV